MKLEEMCRRSHGPYARLSVSEWPQRRAGYLTPGQRTISTAEGHGQSRDSTWQYVGRTSTARFPFDCYPSYDLRSWCCAMRA